MQAIKTNKIQQKMDDLIGRQWLYRGRQLTVRGINTTDDQVRIVNDGNTILCNRENIESTLDEFMQVDNKSLLAPETQQNAIQTFSNDAEQIGQLENLVMQNINDIKDSKDNIAQAKAINQAVKTRLDITRLKIDMVKEIRKHREG